MEIIQNSLKYIDVDMKIYLRDGYIDSIQIQCRYNDQMQGFKYLNNQISELKYKNLIFLPIFCFEYLFRIVIILGIVQDMDFGNKTKTWA